MTEPVRPPDIDGLTFIQPLGAGGFADVHVYQQALPSRRVAVKVLRETTDAAALDLFRAEADVMAQLASHPSIVPIYLAGVSGDGRPFLVMELCPGPHLGDRFRVERIPVPEVLEVAVRIASAVETAHRVGILHRDIKPHNILTSAYGAPLLTDFGIASVTDAEGPAHGMSVPWSPPEAFEEITPPDVRSDVFSLGATIYSLLAGRSPFEIPGGANDSTTLMHRISHQDSSRILRADMPESLDRLLRRSMARRLEDRPNSAMAFARGIQEIQIELGLPPTRLEVMDAAPTDEQSMAVVDDARTAVKPISIIIPDALAERGTLLRPRVIRQVEDRTSLHPSRAAAPDTMRARGPEPVSVDVVASTPMEVASRLEGVGTEANPRRVGMIVLALAVMSVLAVVAMVAFGPNDDGDGVVPATQQPNPQDPLILDGPAAPTDLSIVRRRDRVTIRWSAPDGEPGDTYRVAVGPGPADLSPPVTSRRLIFSVPVRSDVTCVRVDAVRDGAVSRPLEDCASTG